ASERTPWGDSCETMFSTEAGAGIKVGTCISTYLKRKASLAPPAKTELRYRDFWGRAEAKRRSLLEALTLSALSREEQQAATERPEGPRSYEFVMPSEANRWMLSPREVSSGFESWPALDDLFPASFQGVNPNRGLEGSVVDTNRDALAARMKVYFSEERFEE